MSRPHPALLRLAQGLIAAGVLLAVLAFAARATDARDGALRALEGGALLLAATAYLAHLASHGPSLRELVLRSGLVTAFVLWAAVQLAPNFRGAALLNDGAIVLFIADLAFVLMPWRLAEPWGLGRGFGRAAARACRPRASGTPGILLRREIVVEATTRCT